VKAVCRFPLSPVGYLAVIWYPYRCHVPFVASSLVALHADDAPACELAVPEPSPPPGPLRLTDHQGGLRVVPGTPAYVVITEQRSVIQRMGSPGRFGGRRTDSVVLSATDRLRLGQLATAVLATAAHNAEAECLQILEAAERKSLGILRDAEEDVAVLLNCLRQLRAERSFGGDPEPRAEASTAEVSVAASDHQSQYAGDSIDDLGADFFASLTADEEDRWRFLDDDVLVGVGPTLVRRWLRRAARPADEAKIDD
jgi:hypothetical protein